MRSVKVIDQVISGEWSMYHGDSAEILRGLEDASIDLTCCSPPFENLYTYSSSERDLGNSRDPSQFFEGFSFIIRELFRVTKPGRIAAMHCQDMATTLVKNGVIGLRDFPGDIIRAFVKEGWIYDGRVTIDKDPQAQAIRTHSKALLFVQLEKDSTWSRPAMADYIVRFRKPGENAVRVKPDLTREEWILWARPIWQDIDESDTLNTALAREEKDERHICPLQLGTIERCVRLWSNPGEVVLSPFAGIGSEGVQSLKLGRKFIGCELKESYYKTACHNLKNACRQTSLFDLIEPTT
jgi:DNA modification methylase